MNEDDTGKKKGERRERMGHNIWGVWGDLAYIIIIISFITPINIHQ